MKKLVKTAKQQFEERLSNFSNPIKEVCHYSTYYLCTDERGFCVILYSYNENTTNVYKEFSFGMKLDDIYTDEDFLCFIVDYWSEYINTPIKELFEWYASADRENAPFSIDIILQFAKVCDKTIFEDLYEEVPDVRIITAKEQWENDSKDFTTQENEGDYPFKVVIDDESLRFYYYEYGYYCNIYPSLESLRKDDIFIKDVTDRLLEFANYEGVGRLQDWIRVGGDFPLSFGWIFYSEYPRTGVIEYEDKELLQEQNITKKDFSTEITDLKEQMIKHIEELHKQGMTLDSDSFLTNAYSITWIDGSYYACENLVSCKLTKSDEGVLCFSENQENDKDVTYDSPLSTLTINTLWSIIDAMR